MKRYMPIKGGGTNLIAYITFLQGISGRGIIEGIEHYAGTSAGSIVSTVLALGYTPDELYQIMSSFNFASLEDSGGLFHMIEGELSERHGLYRGRAFQSWIEGRIAAKIGKPMATFEDLYKKGLPGLDIVTTYLNGGDALICNYQNTPDVIVSEGVRASMSIPVIFDRFRFSQGINPAWDFVDGGVVMNYPIPLFDDKPEDEVLGLFLHDVSNAHPPLEIDGHGYLAFAKANFEALMNAQDVMVLKNEKWVRQTVILDTKGQSSTDFKKTAANQAILEQSGREAAEKYIKLQSL